MLMYVTLFQNISYFIFVYSSEAISHSVVLPVFAGLRCLIGKNNVTGNIPAHPGDTKVLGTTASLIGSTVSPFKSREAKHPSNPCRDWTSFGNEMYEARLTPPKYRSPSKSKCTLEPVLPTVAIISSTIRVC